MSALSILPYQEALHGDAVFELYDASLSHLGEFITDYDGYKLWVALVDESVVGFVQLQDNYLRLVAVHSVHRGQGIGTKLCAFAETQCSGSIFLDVEADNPAVGLYKRLGHAVAKQWQDDGSDSWWFRMEKRLVKYSCPALSRICMACTTYMDRFSSLPSFRRVGLPVQDTDQGVYGLQRSRGTRNAEGRMMTKAPACRRNEEGRMVNREKEYRTFFSSFCLHSSFFVPACFRHHSFGRKTVDQFVHRTDMTRQIDLRDGMTVGQ